MTVRTITRTATLVRRAGVWGTLQRIVGALRWKYVFYRDDLRFDRKYGTETSQAESEYLKAVRSKYVSVAVPYEATKWRHFTQMMRLIPADRAGFMFIDAGSGKGRVLLFAALVGFKHIVGVEFSERLATIARQNIARFGQRKKTGATMTVECLDIASFELPDTDIVLYLYNPFGAELMRIVVDKLRQYADRGGHTAYVAYRNPKCADLFESQPFIETVERTRIHAIYRIKPRIA